MKELDKSGLEFIKMDATKRIHKMEIKERQAYSSEEEDYAEDVASEEGSNESDDDASHEVNSREELYPR